MTSTWVSSWGPLMAQTKKYLLRGSPSQHPGQGCPFQTSGWGCAHSGLCFYDWNNLCKGAGKVKFLEYLLHEERCKFEG